MEVVDNTQEGTCGYRTLFAYPENADGLNEFTLDQG